MTASSPTRTLDADAAPTCHVVLATRDAGLEQWFAAVIADAKTTVDVVRTPGELDALAAPPDVVIIDESLPIAESVVPFLRLRRRWVSALLVAINVPGESAAAALLDAGVDDAIERGASRALVAARLNAAARRARTANALLRRRVGDVVYDRDNRRVWCDGEEVEFAPRELAVLDCLWSRAGEVVRHQSLHDFVWSGVDSAEGSNRVEVYISYVRRKLRNSKQVGIETLRGAGYRLVRKDRE